jgi:hypothetical protein
MAETDPNLRGILGVRKYDKIRFTDPTGMAMYLVLSLPIRKVEWSMVPGGPTSRDEEAAEFAWSCFQDTSHSFNDLISDICLMFPYGWSYFDMSIKRRLGGRRSQFDDGRVGFRKITIRLPRSLYKWEFEQESGDILGMWQYLENPPKGQEHTVYLPLNRALLFRTSREGDNPEGSSIYRPAVRPFDYKRRLEQVEGIGLYRRWAGFPIVNLPDGATARDEVPAGTVSDEERAEDFVKKVYEDRMMGAYLMPGWSFAFGGPEGTVDPTMGQTIIRKDAEMTRAILAQYLLLGLREVGTQALATTLLDAFFLAVDAYLQIIRDGLNRYAVPFLFGYNTDFQGMTGYPTFETSSPRALDLEIVGKYLAAIAQAGGLRIDDPTESFLRSLIPGMPDALPVEEEEAPERPKPESGEEEQEIRGEGEGGEGDEGYRKGGDDLGEVPGRRRFFRGFGSGSGDGSGGGGGENFAAKAAPDGRAAQYHALTDRNMRAQRANLEGWSDDVASQISQLGPEVTDRAVRSKIDDLLLAGLLLMRERSVLDITAAFWLGFGKPAGGPAQLGALQEEIRLCDDWMGYSAGELMPVNPAGGGTLWGDIAGELEGQIAAILLLLKEGREDDVFFLVQEAVQAATQAYSRAELYAGHVWHSIWSGAYQRDRYEEMLGGLPGPIRWVLDVWAKHCRQCPIFGADPPGREYPSWDAMLSVTGGITPGFGTDCDGRCRCHVEVYRAGVWVWA